MYVIEVPYLSLKQIYESGQTYRWLKVNDNKYIIPFRDKAVKIEQKKERLIFDCSEQDFFEIWWNYFDLMKDYSKINDITRKLSEEFKIVANRGKGIHILKQDLFEVIIYSLFIDKPLIIPEAMNCIATKTGIKHKQAMNEAGKVTWYEFPTPELLLNNLDKLENYEVGGKLDLIEDVCTLIQEGWLDLELLSSLDYEEAKEYLLDFEEFGQESAELICLFGLHKLQAFPCDGVINSILKKNLMTYEEFYIWFIEENGTLDNSKGILRQYLWYNKVNPPKRIEIWMRQ